MSDPGSALVRAAKAAGIVVVPVPGAKYLVFWEEAKDSPHVVNETATAIAREAESIQAGDYIAGVVVVVPREALA